MSGFLNKTQAYKAVREERKNTGDKYFSAQPQKTHDHRNLDAACELELFFEDADIASLFEGSKITWQVTARDKMRSMTMNSVLRLDKVRVSSIDPQKVPLSYRYDSGTIRRGKYHMNIITYDKNNKICNIHLDLNDVQEYFTDIEEFARFAAEQWNIEFKIEDRLL